MARAAVPVRTIRDRAESRVPVTTLTRLLWPSSMPFYYCRPIAVKSRQEQIKKALRETQTLRADCSKAEPNFFAPPQTPFPGRGMAKI